MASIYETIFNIEEKQRRKLIEFLENTSISREDLYDRIQYDNMYREMSEEQKRLFVANRIQGNNIAYNMPYMFKVLTEVDLIRLEKAINYCISKCELLRTTFHVKDDSYTVNVHDELYIEIKKICLQKEQVEIVTRNFIKPFRLDRLPLICVGWLEVEGGDNFFLWDMHHIIGDGISCEILFQQIENYYKNGKADFESIQYTHYAKWQKERWMNSLRHINQKNYWISSLQGVKRLNLPYDNEEIIDKKCAVDMKFVIEGDSYDIVSSNISKFHVTEFMYFIAFYSILLSIYSGQDDIVIGFPVSGRIHPDTEKMIGPFINILALRSYPKLDKILYDFLDEIKSTVIKGLDNQEYPFNKLVNDLGLAGKKTPLFNTMFSYHNYRKSSYDMDEKSYVPVTIGGGETKYDLTLEIEKKDRSYIVFFTYTNNMFNRITIERMFQTYEKLLKIGYLNKEMQIGCVDIISDKEQYELLYSNQGKISCPPNTLMEYFEYQVKKNPLQVCIIFNGEEINFLEIAQRSDIYASYIRQLQLGENPLIGVMLERNVDLIACMLGILKAGAAYLPIDINYPKDRVNHILNESRIGVLFASEDVNVSELDFQGIAVSKMCNQESVGVSSYSSLKGDETAYVIYTSGSTGNPKGVEISRKSLDNFIFGITNSIDFSRGNSILGLTTISFDIFVLETWVALALGKTIILASQEEQNSPKMLLELIKSHKVDILQVTPSRLRLMFKYNFALEYLQNIHILLIGGEAFPEDLLENLYKLKYAEIYNVYGPTESTVWSSVARIGKKEKITAGYPIDNTNFYILRDKKLVPFGAQGDLFIGGAGVAKGYYFQKNLTAEKFIVNPYNENEIIYDTGDIAKKNSEGQIIVLGRRDNQIKLHGFRIELEEIEHNILLYNGIEEATVIVNQGKLWAFIVEQGDVDLNILRNYLSNKIPKYMIPSFIKKVQRIPLNANGKVDRNSLIGACTNSPLRDSVKPRSQKEQDIADCIKRVLNIEEIGIYDSFFELGGNSINAIQLEIMLEERNISIEAFDLYNKPTIAELCGEYTYRRVQGEENEKTEWMIQPYNELFYMNCFYNSLIPVFGALVQSNLPILANSISVYISEKGVISSKYIIDKSIEDILREYGINFEKIRTKENILSTIQEKVLQNKVLICWVDCFYLEYRKDKFSKEHFPHTILIVKQDEMHQEVEIIDHSRYDALNYQYRKLSFEELEKATNGFLDNYDCIIENLWIFSNRRLFVNDVNLVKLYKSYQNMLKENNEKIEEGVNQITFFRNRILNLKVGLSDIIDGMNKIVDACRVRVLFVKYLTDSKNINKLINEILDSWIALRGAIVKELFHKRKQITEIMLDDMSEKLENIEKMERKLQKKFLNQTIEIGEKSE